MHAATLGLSIDHNLFTSPAHIANDKVTDRALGNANRCDMACFIFLHFTNVVLKANQIGARERRLIRDATVERRANISITRRFHNLATMSGLTGKVTGRIGIEDANGNLAGSVIGERHATNHIVATQNRAAVQMRYTGQHTSGGSPALRARWTHQFPAIHRMRPV